MELLRSIVVGANPSKVFEVVSDPSRYRDFMVGVTRWDPRSKRRRGKGARFKVLMKVGAIEAGGVVRITEWEPGRHIAWSAETGLQHEGRWDLRKVEGGGTELGLSLKWDLVGPLSGVVERLAARVVARNMEASLLAVSRLLGGPADAAAGAAPAERASRLGGLRRAVDRARFHAGRTLDAVHPRSLGTLRRAGVVGLGEALGAVGAAPWLLGRGVSLGIVGRINAVSVGRKAAVWDRSGMLTWAELDERANRLVHVLADRGVGPGDRVALVLRNGREFAEALLACQRVGIVAAPLNTWAKAQELRTALESVQPSLLIYDGLHAEAVGRAAPKRLSRLVVGKGGGSGPHSYEASLAAAGTAPPPPVARNRGSARVVVHTSGTTGKPKGAARDARIMGVRESVGLLSMVPFRRDDVIVIPAPMFHSFGLLAFILGSVLGATMVLPERFDPEGTLELIDQHRATAAALVPVMLNRILSLPPEVRQAHDVSSIRVVLASGSAIPHDVREAVDELFPEALYDLYGSTEAGWVAIATPQDMASRPGTVGRPVWGVEVAVFSPEGKRLGPGEDGELHVKSAAMFEGYTGGEEHRGRDGYIGLGDLGRVDHEGYVFVAGRVDDMTVIGGENVYPSEVESVIRGVAGVEDVAVFGVPDPEYGEVLAAFVVGSVVAQDVTKACKAELASFKVPRRVVIVDELPRTDTGKVLKRELVPLIDSA